MASIEGCGAPIWRKPTLEQATGSSNEPRGAWALDQGSGRTIRQILFDFDHPFDLDHFIDLDHPLVVCLEEPILAGIIRVPTNAAESHVDHHPDSSQPSAHQPAPNTHLHRPSPSTLIRVCSHSDPLSRRPIATILQSVMAPTSPSCIRFSLIECVHPSPGSMARSFQGRLAQR